MLPPDFKSLRIALAVHAKHGLDFILAASVVWLAIAMIWTLPYRPYDLSVLTFMVGGVMLPLAWLLSKVLKTQWRVPGNPLQPLGLWLNVAQLFYFPILVYLLLRDPEHFLIGYIIITGAHFFPYAWFYDEVAFAIMAGVIAVGGLLVGLWLPLEQMYWLAIFMVSALLALAVWLWVSWRKKATQYAAS